MQKIITSFLLLLIAGSAATAYAQGRLAGQHELSINAFRNPSIGAEYRRGPASLHAGYYPTAFKAGENTGFVKAGLTLWFLPIGRRQPIPSSFYAGASYLRGLSRDYEGKAALGLEAGFRWMVWKGINLRIGGIAVAAKGEGLKINPAPGLSYSFIIK